jgi:hypothetical protein
MGQRRLQKVVLSTNSLLGYSRSAADSGLAEASAGLLQFIVVSTSKTDFLFLFRITGVSQ